MAMMGLALSLRQLCRVLSALMLVAAILSPTLDMLECAGEKAHAATAATEQVIADSDADVAADMLDHSQHKHDSGKEGCVHGHCHHGTGVAKLVDLAELRGQAPLMPSPAAYNPLPSIPPLQILHPPRA